MLTWIDKGSSRNIFIKMLIVFSLNNTYIYREREVMLYDKIRGNKCKLFWKSTCTLFAFI